MIVGLGVSIAFRLGSAAVCIVPIGSPSPPPSGTGSFGPAVINGGSAVVPALSELRGVCDAGSRYGRNSRERTSRF